MIEHVGEHLWAGQLGHTLAIVSLVGAVLGTLGYFLGTTWKSVEWADLGRIGFRLHSVAVLGIVITLFTMLFGGLWHGASWTFVFWGFYHGVLLCAYRVYRTSWDAMPKVIQRGAMFSAAILGWIFFRATSFSEATGLLRTMFVPTAGEVMSDVALPLVLSVMAVAAWWSLRGPNAFEMKHEWTPMRRISFAVACGAGLALIVTARPSPFLYFQF